MSTHDEAIIPYVIPEGWTQEWRGLTTGDVDRQEGEVEGYVCSYCHQHHKVERLDDLEPVVLGTRCHEHKIEVHYMRMLDCGMPDPTGHD